MSRRTVRAAARAAAFLPPLALPLLVAFAPAGGRSGADLALDAPRDAPPDVRTDRALARAVRHELERAEVAGGEARALAFRVHDGVVTLNGLVPSVAARERAVDAIAALPDVRSVESLVRVREAPAAAGAGENEVAAPRRAPALAPPPPAPAPPAPAAPPAASPAPASDVRLAEAVLAALRAHPRLAPYDRPEELSVVASAGAVELVGTVASAEARAEAERVAAAVPGVLAVRSLLRVPGEPAPAEGPLAAALEASFPLADLLLAGARTLEAAAPAPAADADAGAPVDVARLVVAIERALFRSPLSRATAVVVDADEDGSVVLRGVAASAAERDVAAEAALLAGATRVRNLLVVPRPRALARARGVAGGS